MSNVISPTQYTGITNYVVAESVSMQKSHSFYIAGQAGHVDVNSENNPLPQQ